LIIQVKNSSSKFLFNTNPMGRRLVCGVTYTCGSGTGVDGKFGLLVSCQYGIRKSSMSRWQTQISKNIMMNEDTIKSQRRKQKKRTTENQTITERRKRKKSYRRYNQMMKKKSRSSHRYESYLEKENKWRVKKRKATNSSIFFVRFCISH